MSVKIKSRAGYVRGDGRKDEPFHDPILKRGNKTWNGSKAQKDSAEFIAQKLNIPYKEALALVTR